MSSVLTFTPSNVTVDLSGYILTGIVSVSVKRNTPSYTKINGIRGVHTRRRALDRSVTFEIEVLQTSPTNTILSRIENGDYAIQTGMLSISVTDSNGKDWNFQSNNAFVSDGGRVKLSRTAENRVWVIEGLTATGSSGGASESPLALFDSIQGFDIVKNILGG